MKGFTLATDKGVEKVKRGKFPGRCPACKEDIFTTFDWLQATILKVHARAGCGGI